MKGTAPGKGAGGRSSSRTLAGVLAPLAAGFAVLGTSPSAVGAQDAGRPVVEQVGSSDIALDRRLKRLLATEPLIVTQDLRVEAGDTLQGGVLVLDATLVLEGTVTGDLVLVDAGAFVRPGAVILGDLVNMGGGLYRSELSRVGGVIIDVPTASYRVVREPGRFLIYASDSPSALSLDGVMGLHVPAYDRVNGITAIWGARYRLPPLGDVMPSVHGQVGWMTERGEPTYAASFELRRFGTALTGGYEDAWTTNEDWIRDDLQNSLNYLWNGNDVRDYHHARRTWLGLSREYGDTEKTLHVVAGVRGQIEDASSLEGGAPWQLWGDTARSNPAIDPGRITSAIASMEVEWRGRETYFQGGVEYEAARDWLDGEFTFDRISVRGDWAMHAFADHTLEIELFAQQPVGETMPRQRWSFVGGTGTLQTLEVARFYGDRVVFVESRYIIPLPDRLALPLLGAPELRLLHAAGMAWVGDAADRNLEQEMGIRLQFFGLYFRYMVAPAEPPTHSLDIGLSWPYTGSFPWERR